MRKKRSRVWAAKMTYIKKAAKIGGLSVCKNYDE